MMWDNVAEEQWNILLLCRVVVDYVIVDIFLNFVFKSMYRAVRVRLLKLDEVL